MDAFITVLVAIAACALLAISAMTALGFALFIGGIIGRILDVLRAPCAAERARRQKEIDDLIAETEDLLRKRKSRKDDPLRPSR